jgi:adenosylcobinamide-GDP ribazoletransferase
MFDTLLTAIGFLTILPVRLRRPPRAGDLGRSALWFPLVGLLIGAVNAAAWLLFFTLFPPQLAAVLTTGLWAALTGGLHLDGLADCCDGLFSAAAKERRLEIMRDPHIGAFGVIGLVFFLLLKSAAVDGLPAGLITPALIVAPALARFFLLPASLLAAARPDGLGQEFQEGLTRGRVILAAIMMLIVFVLTGWQFLAAGLFAALTAGGVLLLAKMGLGGLTGDVLGMMVELSELAFMLFLCLPLT